MCFDVTCIKRNGVCVRYRIRKAVHPGLRERGEQIRSYERGSLWNVFIDPQQGMAEAIQWTKLEYSLHFHIWAIISSVMDTFLTVFVLQSKNEKRYGSNQCIPVLIYIWTKVCPIRYFGFAR